MQTYCGTNVTVVLSEIYFKKEQQSLLDMMTVREAWEALVNVYHSASLGNIFRLANAFNSIKHLPG